MADPVSILLIEDSETDVEIAEWTFKKANITNPLYIAGDGVQALEMLSAEDENKIAQPCVLLIDINMPRMDGFAFLEAIRDNQALNKNIAFMLTTSSWERDIERAYSMNVAGYILKDDIKRLSEFLGGYLKINHFPDGHREINVK